MSGLLPTNWLDKAFVSAYSIDSAGLGVLSPVETYTNGDTNTTIRGRYGSALSTTAAAFTVALPWAIAANSCWAFEAYIVVKSSTLSVRRKIKISAIVYGVGSVATIDGTPDIDAKGTGAAAAAITVTGSSSAVFLTLTPGIVANMVWGFEVRGQQT